MLPVANQPVTDLPCTESILPPGIRPDSYRQFSGVCVVWMWFILIKTHVKIKFSNAIIVVLGSLRKIIKSQGLHSEKRLLFISQDWSRSHWAAFITVRVGCYMKVHPTDFPLLHVPTLHSYMCVRYVMPSAMVQHRQGAFDSWQHFPAFPLNKTLLFAHYLVSDI